LLACTVPAYHGDALMNFVIFNCSKIMALITCKRTTATSVPSPLKIVLIVIASSFKRKLLIFLKLKLLNKRVEMLDPIVGNVHVSKTSMTVDLKPLPREIKFILEYLFITVTPDLPGDSANINEFPINQVDPTNKTALIMNNLPLPYNAKLILTFLTLEPNRQFKLLPQSCIKEIHEQLGAIALNIKQHFLNHQVRTVLHDQGLNSDLIVEILVLELLHILQGHLEIVTELFIGGGVEQVGVLDDWL